MNKLINEVDNLKQELNEAIKNNDTPKITNLRGRLINKIRKTVTELEKQEDKTQEEIDLLKKYIDELVDETFAHKMNLKERYSEEFLKGEAKIADIFTTLPKGIAIQVKRVVNTISELKNAKNNKARLKALVSFGKQLGLLALTPVIFAGKFAIEHWYLLLLLLLRFRLDIFGKDKAKEVQVKDELLKQEQEQEAYEFAMEPVPEEALENVLTPAGDVEEPVGEIVDKPDIVKPFREIIKRRPIKPVLNIPIDKEVKVLEQSPAKIPEVSLKDMVREVVCSKENYSAIEELLDGFVDSIERNYNYVIGTRHPNMEVVYNADEYVAAVHRRNPLINIDVNTAKEFYQRHNDIPYGVEELDEAIIWPEADKVKHYFANEEELANYLANGNNQNFNMYFNNYIQNGGNIGLFSGLSDLVAQSPVGPILESMGITGTLAVVIFALWKAGEFAMGGPGLAMQN